MVRSEEIIKRLKECFYYKEGDLFWKEGFRYADKAAGYKNTGGYIEINMNLGPKNNMKILGHRAIFAMHNGYLPALVDHIDQNPRNNKVDNLRDASKKINAINTGLPKNNKTGVKGVILTATGFCAYIHTSINNISKKLHLGSFKTLEDAKQARKQAEEKYWANL